MAIYAAIAIISALFGAWLFDFMAFALGGMPEDELKLIKAGAIVTPIVAVMTAVSLRRLFKTGVHQKLHLPAPVIVLIAVAAIGYFLWYVSIFVFAWCCAISG